MLGGLPYNWNNTTFYPGLGLDWPGHYRSMLNPTVDLVADYVAPGLILYWIEPRLSVYVPLVVPNKRLVRPPNWTPSQSPVYQPAYAIFSYQEACGYTLIAIGGTIIAVTIIEDVSTMGVGVIDDIATVPGGMLLIDIGRRVATFVAVQATP